MRKLLKAEEINIFFGAKLGQFKKQAALRLGYGSATVCAGFAFLRVRLDEDKGF